MDSRLKQCKINKELLCARITLDQVKHQTKIEEMAVEELQESLERTTKEKTCLESKLQDYEKAMKTNEILTNELSELEENNQNQRRAIRTIEDAIDDKTSALEEIEIELASVQERHKLREQLITDYNRYKLQIPTLEEEIDIMKSKLEQLETSYKEENSKRSQLEMDNKGLEKELEDHPLRSQMLLDLEEAQKIKDELINDLRIQCPDLDLEDLEKTIESYSRTKAKHDQLLKELEETKNKQAQLEDQCQELKLEIGDKKTQIKVMEERKKAILDQRELTRVRMDSLEREIHSIEDKYRISDSQRDEVANNQLRLNSLTMSNDNLRQEIEQLKEKIYGWYKSVQEATDQCYASWNDYKVSSERLEELKKEAAKYRQMLTQSVRSPSYDFDVYLQGRAESSASSHIDPLHLPPMRPPTPPSWQYGNGPW